MSDVIIHIGMPKTGSTFLQWDVFRHAKDINFIFRGPALNKIVAGIKDRKVKLPSLATKVEQFLYEDKPNFISEENLYCDMWTKEDNRYEYLERIKQLFPKARVIFGTRDGEKMLVSWYKQYVAVGGTLSFEEFLSQVMNLDKLHYEPYQERLFDLFGNENVFAFTLSELIQERVCV